MAQRRPRRDRRDEEIDLNAWIPRTSLGKMVKDGQITDIDEILDSGKTILESEIVDSLLSGIENDLLLVGQSKGKFGGGQRRVFRQTQKKTAEGNRPQFTAVAIVGNRDGYLGIGIGKSKETVPARQKAVRNAKINLFKIRRGSGSWQDNSTEPHSIPFAVSGKNGSVVITFKPAPPGTGLVAHKEVQKILAYAGIKNIWSKTHGHRKTTMNMIRATEKALRMLMRVKTKATMVEGAHRAKNVKADFEAVAEESP